MGESKFGDVDFLFRLRIIFLTGDALYAILNLLPMTTMNDKSLTKAADPSFVVIGSALLTSQGSVAFAGLRNGGAVVAVQDGSVGKIYPISSLDNPNPGAVELTVPPVATWIGKPMLICKYCNFMEQYGDGPVEYIPFCNLCKLEMPGMFEEESHEA